VELFFRVLGYYQTETRKYPPSKQFLSSCISILGQVRLAPHPGPRSWGFVVVESVVVRGGGGTYLLSGVKIRVAMAGWESYGKC